MNFLSPLRAFFLLQHSFTLLLHTRAHAHVHTLDNLMNSVRVGVKLVSRQCETD